MKKYNPEVAPDSAEWLALDEQERIQLVDDHHRAARIKLPSRRAHACIHAIVENQLAEGLEPVIQALARLRSQGLSRHDALHAIGSVLAEHMHAVLNSQGESNASTSNARYYARLEGLTADAWLRSRDD